VTFSCPICEPCGCSFERRKRKKKERQKTEDRKKGGFFCSSEGRKEKVTSRFGSDVNTSERGKRSLDCREPQTFRFCLFSFRVFPRIPVDFFVLFLTSAFFLFFFSFPLLLFSLLSLLHLTHNVLVSPQNTNKNSNQKLWPSIFLLLLLSFLFFFFFFFFRTFFFSLSFSFFPFFLPLSRIR